MKNNIKKTFEEFIKESIEPVDDIKFEIDDKFENELSMVDMVKLERESVDKDFTEKEVIQLNLYFGIYKDRESYGYYLFDKKFGVFGTPITTLKGKIRKKIKVTGKILFILDFFMTVKVGSNKSDRHLFLKFKTIDEIIEFFKSFER